MSEIYSQESIDHQVPPSSEILNLSAEEVSPETILDPEIQEIIDRMLRVAYGRKGNTQYPTLVGLAAPQIGISKRIVIIGLNSPVGGEQPELKVFINPVIVEKSKEKEEGREGCFSTDRVCGIVERSKRVTIRAYDREGYLITQVFEGFPARVAQHEIDHLDGIRFPDIIDDSKLHWVEDKEYGSYREHWDTWKNICPRSRWEDIKSGTYNL